MIRRVSVSTTSLNPRLDEHGVHPAILAEAEAILADKAGRDRLADHATVTARGSAAERLAFLALSRQLSSESVEGRRRLLEQLPATASPLDGQEVEHPSGTLVLELGGWGPVTDAVEEARAAFADPRRSGGDNPGKLFMTTARLKRPLESRIMALARHPALLALVGRYLDGLPILYRINLLDSANEALQPDSSQFFHVDPEDFRQLKAFLLVEEVDEETGPLHLLRADASDEVRVARGHRLGRLTDTAVLDQVGANALVACTGPAGTLAIGDTSRCFHFGSRPGRRRRHVVMIQYITAFASVFPLGQGAVGSRYADAVRRRAEEAGEQPGDLEARLFGLVR